MAVDEDHDHTAYGIQYQVGSFALLPTAYSRVFVDNHCVDKVYAGHHKEECRHEPDVRYVRSSLCAYQPSRPDQEQYKG